jgi:hypothetical protein
VSRPRGRSFASPDLGDAGVAAIRAALDAPDLRAERLDAISAGRTAALGPLRLVEWLGAVTDPRSDGAYPPLHAPDRSAARR